MKKITVRELFETIEVDIPDDLIESKDDYLENVSYVPTYIREGGAYFCSDKYTKNRDVNEFMEEVLKSKPKVVFITKDQYDNLTISGPFVQVYYMYNKIVKVTKLIKSKYQARTIAVTGSLGKTTTKDMLYSVLGKCFYVIRSFDNENTIGYLLKNIQRLTDKHEFLIHEFGADLPTIMPRTASAAIPTASVITNISDPHLDTFKTHEAILDEKLQMAKTMMAGSPVFLNYDDERLRNASLRRYKIISIGIDNKDVDYYADNINESEDSIEFDIIHNQKAHRTKINVIGKYNIYNALISFAIGDYYGMPINKILEGLESFRIVGTRQSIVYVGARKIFIDAYNSAPKTIVSSISTLEKMQVKNKGRRIAVISDMARLGIFSKELHVKTANDIKDTNIDVMYFFGNEDSKAMAETIEKSDSKIEVYYTDDRSILNKWIEENVTVDDILLFKGAIHRLLTKTIDYAFGSAYHVKSEYYYHKTLDNIKYKIIYEKANIKGETLALCKYLGNEESVEIPSSYKDLDLFAICTNCFYKTNVKKVVIPDCVRNIGCCAFSSCKELEEISLPSSLNVIETSAFEKCEKLKRITIPTGTTHIDDNAFMDCTSLEEVIIPDTIEYFGKSLFANSNNVTFKYMSDGKIHDYLQIHDAKIKLSLNESTGQLEAIALNPTDLTHYKSIPIRAQ